LSISSVCAQTGDKKQALIIHAGLSVPFSDFAGTSFGHLPGFAGNGMNAEADYLKYVGRYFGLSLTTGYANMDFREDAYRNEYRNILGQEGDIAIDAGNYQLYRAMLGLAVRTPEFHNFELLFILHLGYACFIHPEIKVDFADLGRINTVDKNVDPDNIKCYSFRLNYFLSEKYGINLTCNRNFAKPDFLDETGIANHYILPVQFQNINAGLVIRL